MRYLYFSISIFSALFVGLAGAFFFSYGIKVGTFEVASVLYSLWAPPESSTLRPLSEAVTTNEVIAAIPRTLAQDIIPKTGPVIWADLREMKLTFYENGFAIKTYPIVAKGKRGSAWETPPGQYSVKKKESIHFSSIGEVYMPFSMQFFGNYFIHGWPFYPGGKEVPAGYSGGCIRLATIDMEDLFKRSPEGTPIFVSDTPDAQKVLGAYHIDQNSVPDISATAFLVADLDTGEVITSKNQKEKLPMASLTKLLTALTSLEAVNQFQTATVSKRAEETYGESGNLKTGEKIPIQDLLHALLLESSNDAAEVIAEHIGRSYFMALMKSKALAIGLDNTLVSDPSGISPQNVSTAEDLFSLAQYIFFHKKFVLDVTKSPHYQTTNHRFANNSRFFADKGYIGGKNGYTTAAAHTLVALYSLPLSETGNRNIAIVLLGSDNKETDARALLNFLVKQVAYTGHETQ